MFQGLKLVLLIFILTLFISILFRLIIALLRCTTTKLIGYVLEAYILFMRGTPPSLTAHRDLSLLPLLEVGILYRILIAFLSNVFTKLEKRYSYYA